MRTLIGLLVLVVGCGPAARNGDNTGDAGVDGPGAECVDGTKQCDGNSFQHCMGGFWLTSMQCSATCDPVLGCVACMPNVDTCQDGDVHSCDASGAIGPVTMACTGANICEGGVCSDACAESAMNRSYTGCEYWAVDLDNALEVVDVQDSINCELTTGVKNVTMSVCADAASDTVAGLCDPPNNSCPSGFTCKPTAVCILDAEHAPFAIVVSNPNARSVDVTVTGAGGQTFTQTVAAGQVASFLPQATPQSLPDQSIDGTGTTHAAYEVTAQLPIVAYQFNPLDNVDVFSNDASLLIPRTAFDIEYYVMAWPTEDRRTPAPGTNDFYGYLTVVAWHDNTVVEVTPTAAVQASATQTTIAAGTATQFTLNAFDVLNLEAASPGDLTGSKVRAVNGTDTFGVFGGQEAMFFGGSTPPDATHTEGPCCADHIEEMMFPTSTWGMTFAIARSQQRSNENDLIRVLAQKANTHVTITPAPVTGSCGTLAPGEFCQFEISGDTAIAADQPILVGHYLESAIWQDPVLGDAVGTGDPSMAISVPVEQFRSDYIIPVPAAYDMNYLSIAAPPTGTVQVDGTTVMLTGFANNSYRAARVLVGNGQHHITCTQTCGVEVYGYSDAVSYQFAGGLDLKQIVNIQ